MHTDLCLLETSHRADLEIRSEDQTARALAKSNRTRVRPLEHATLQGPRAARFSGGGEGEEKPDAGSAAVAIAPLLLCRSRFLFRSARTAVPIFSERANQDHQVGRVPRQKSRNARFRFSFPWRAAVDRATEQGQKRCAVRARDHAGGATISARYLFGRHREG